MSFIVHYISGSRCLHILGSWGKYQICDEEHLWYDQKRQNGRVFHPEKFHLLHEKLHNYSFRCKLRRIINGHIPACCHVILTGTFFQNSLFPNMSTKFTLTFQSILINLVYYKSTFQIQMFLTGFHHSKVIKIYSKWLLMHTQKNFINDIV